MKLTEKIQGAYAEFKAVSDKTKAELIAAVKQAVTDNFQGRYSWHHIDETYEYPNGIGLSVLDDDEYVDAIDDAGFGWSDYGREFLLEDLTCEDLHHILEVFDEIIDVIAETTQNNG